MCCHSCYCSAHGTQTPGLVFFSLESQSASTVCIRVSSNHLKSRVQRLEISEFSWSWSALRVSTCVRLVKSCPSLSAARALVSPKKSKNQLRRCNAQFQTCLKTCHATVLMSLCGKDPVVTITKNSWRECSHQGKILADLWHLSCTLNYVFSCLGYPRCTKSFHWSWTLGGFLDQFIHFFRFSLECFTRSVLESRFAHWLHMLALRIRQDFKIGKWSLSAF